MSYIDLVTSGDFTLKKLFKDDGETVEFVKDQKIDEPKKELKGILTEFVTNEFFKDHNQISNFIKLVCDSYNNVFIEYTKAKGLNIDDIIFVYKGGNIMRFIFKEFLRNYSKTISNEIEQMYMDSFKRSDADFSIYIRPTLNDYEQIYREVCDLTFLIQNEIRNIFMKNRDSWFEFFKKDKNIQKETLGKYLKKLQESNYVKEYNKTISGIMFGDIKVDSNKKYEIREDSTKFFDNYEKPAHTTQIKLNKIMNLNDPSLESLINAQKESYANYIGPQMFISANELAFGVSFFNLIRTKWIIDVVIDNRVVITDGELIDVSIIRKEDEYIQHFFDHLSDNIYEYNVGTNLKFKAYSLKYLIQDLEKILFTISEFPWSDSKYEKRIRRLIFFYLITLMLNKNIHYNFSNEIKYLDRVTSLLNESSNMNLFKKKLLDELKSDDLGVVDLEKNPFIALLNNFVKIVTSKNIDSEEFRKYINTVKTNVGSIKQILDHISTIKPEINEYSLTFTDKIAGGDPYYKKYLTYKTKYSELKKTFKIE